MSIVTHAPSASMVAFSSEHQQQYTEDAQLWQNKTLISGSSTTIFQTDLYDQLLNLLAPGGISKFQRTSSNKCNTNVVPTSVLFKREAVAQMSMRLFNEMQSFETKCLNHGRIYQGMDKELGVACREANGFAQYFVDNIDPQDDDNTLITTKDTIAAAYVLVMLVAWKRTTHLMSDGKDFWDNAEAEIRPVFDEKFKNLQNCSETFSRSYLSVLTAGVKYGGVSSKNNILRALGFLFRNNEMSLGIGNTKECSIFMTQVYAYYADMTKSTPVKRTREVEDGPKKRSRAIETGMPYMPQNVNISLYQQVNSCSLPVLDDEVIPLWIKKLYVMEISENANQHLDWMSVNGELSTQTFV